MQAADHGARRGTARAEASGDGAHARPPKSRLGCAAALFGGAAALSPAPASAGAWLQADQLIISAAAGQQARRPLQEVGLAWERSLGARTGVTFQAYAAGGDAYAGRWTGEAVGGGKWLVAKGETSALSVQASAVAPLRAQSACDSLGAELRIAAGRSIGAAFVDIQAAYRAQNQACAHARLDATLGWRPSSRWLTMAQVFADRDLLNEETVKAQLSVARFAGDDYAVQIGARARVDENEFRESALLIALWRTL